jgi:hypothetical protein
MDRCRTVLCFTLLAAVACDSHPWEGFVYPKTGKQPFDLAIGHYATLEECRASALAILSKTTPEPGSTPDYECGRNCRIQTEPPPPPGLLAMRICDETSR